MNHSLVDFCNLLTFGNSFEDMDKFPECFLAASTYTLLSDIT
jgi:hypothetical protein